MIMSVFIVYPHCRDFYSSNIGTMHYTTYYKAAQKVRTLCMNNNHLTFKAIFLDGECKTDDSGALDITSKHRFFIQLAILNEEGYVVEHQSGHTNACVRLIQLCFMPKP